MFINNMGWASINLNLNIWEEGAVGSEVLALVAFICLLAYFIWDSLRAKVED
jgi:hypothetical protein